MSKSKLYCGVVAAILVLLALIAVIVFLLTQNKQMSNKIETIDESKD